ncbi:MAG: carboxypeptidase regulatory-like domain-containing protein [Longimicrobiales bacterium]
MQSPKIRRAFWCHAVFLTAVFTFMPHALHAQTTGNILGRVVDGTGVPIATASIEVIGTTTRVVAGSDGRFIIGAVAPGARTIRVERLGYRPMLIDLVVRGGQSAEVRVVMETAPVELPGVSVTLQARRVRMIEPDVSGSHDITVGSELRELPIDKLEKAIELTPGVSNGHFRGGRAGQEVYVVDGLEVKNQFEASTQGLGLELSPTALEEVEVMTGGFGAQFGSALSGVVSYVTRRGSLERWQARGALTTDQWVPNSMFYGFNGLNASAGGPLKFLGTGAALYVDFLAQGMLDADPRARGLTCLHAEEADESLINSIENLQQGANSSLYCPFTSTIIPHQQGDKLIAFARFDKPLGAHLNFAATLLRNRFQRELYTPAFRFSEGSQLGQNITGSLATATLEWSKQRATSAWHVTARGGFMRIDRYLGAVDQDALDSRSTLAGFGFSRFKFVGQDFVRSPIDEQLANGGAVPGYTAPVSEALTPYGPAGIGLFFTGGTPNVANWARTDMASADLVAEMIANTGSLLRVGANGKFYGNESYERVLAYLPGSSPTYARFYPRTVSAFTEGHIAVSDEINFDVGIRMDAFRSGIDFLKNRNDFLSPVVDDSWNTSINPRLGVSFPLASSNNTRVLRFNYGYVSQPPDFRYFLDTTIGDSLRTDIRRQGNPALSFEKGKSYEVALSQLLFEGKGGISITAFRKELSNVLTGSLRIGETGAQQYSTNDFGKVNGAEISMRARSGFWGVRGSWSIQKATGIASGLSSDTLVKANAREVPLAFDRRHSIDIVINAGRAAGVEDSPWSGSMTTVTQSGYPVSRASIQNDTTTRGAAYLPWTSTTDMRITRELGKFGCRTCAWRISFDARNLLGLKNVLAYRSDTGSLSPTSASVDQVANTVKLPDESIPRESARYSASIDTNKDGLINVGEFRSARFAAALDRFDPTLYFGEPRQLRLGFEVNFR